MQAFKSDFYQKYSLGIELLNLSNCTKALLLEHIIVQDRNSVQRRFVLWADLENTSLVWRDLSDVF